MFYYLFYYQENLHMKIRRFVIHNKILYQFIQLMGICILSTGLYVTGGYIAHRWHPQKWDSLVEMPLITAILFILVGIVFFLIMLYIKKMEARIDNIENGHRKVRAN